MSWTDVFPVLDDGMIEQFESEVSTEERAIFDGWFEVKRIVNRRTDYTHLVSASLFWKRDTTFEGEMPAVTRELMINAQSSGLAGRFPPWETYVVPIMDCATILGTERPDAVLRVYLANDLSFLVDELSDLGCEVYLMKESSIRHNPGAMWRFLALEDGEHPVTITDADRAREIVSDITRTEASIKVEVGGWRVPYDFKGTSQEGYRPFNASQFGSTKSYQTKSLMQSFIWHNLHGSMSKTCKLAGLRENQIAGTNWPDYGFDEWFLLAAMYPRMAFEGLLTFYPWDMPPLGQFFTLDIEYCTWANSKSELINYSREYRPWVDWKDSSRLKVRPKTSVIKRKRKKIGVAQGIFNHYQREGLHGYPEHSGDLRSLLARTSAEVDTEWWIDLNPQLYPFVNGCELFLDRRYDEADVAFCGFFFMRVTRSVAAWAEYHGLEACHWTEGSIVKLPKLEGPMTLWKTGFSKSFHAALIDLDVEVRPEVLMKGWMEEGRVSTSVSTARKMGWRVR